MGKALGISLGLYGATGVLVMAWTAHRGGAGRAHWQGYFSDPGANLVAGIVAWPHVVYVNATAPAISVVQQPQQQAAAAA